MAKATRVRKAEAGFVGISLVKDGDMTLFKRLEKEVKSNSELTRSSVIRTALKEYFERKDAK
jgi:metal-responsive CopG/Arc/MetJ family transcriptional regulator